MLLLVRHAIAVSRDGWEGPDDRRPLTARGERQAAGLPAALAELPMEQILTSPTRRCTATVAPLAAARQVPVKRSKAFREGRGEDALDLVVDAIEDLVVCTHGDVALFVLRRLRHLGFPLPDRPPCAKGSVWLLSSKECEYLRPPA